jgi:hypothetical protein
MVLMSRDRGRLVEQSFFRLHWFGQEFVGAFQEIFRFLNFRFEFVGPFPVRNDLSVTGRQIDELALLATAVPVTQLRPIPGSEAK